MFKTNVTDIRILFFAALLLLIGCSGELSKIPEYNNTPTVEKRVPASTNANSDSLQVIHAVNEFLDAFTNLNWSKFTACFANDATAFFPPSSKFPYRANNKNEVENIFEHVFENARKQKSTPPYIVIQPQDLKIQLAGTTAIVTFMLNDPDLFGRRTLVLKKDHNKWLIVHLHASGVVVSK